MPRIDDQALGQLFTDARSHSHWQDEDVTDQELRDLYDLVKWGPTSANTCPARFVFVRSGPAKDRLISALAPGNVEKVRTAPVTAIVAYDERFYDQLPKLAPHAPKYREMFASDQALAEATRFRNGSLQGAYLILAARAIGLDCGPMSGFDNDKLDELFFAGTSWRSNFLCALGHGEPSKLHPRAARLSFEEACQVLEERELSPAHHDGDGAGAR
jgi:nitroreductase